MSTNPRYGMDNIAATRKKIATPGFDPTVFLEGQIATVSMTDPDAEKKLLLLFDNLTDHLTGVSQEIENEASIITEAAMSMEATLFDELNNHSTKLKNVGKSVDDVKINFDHASEGAVRIGSRLASAEKERVSVERGLELMSLIQQFQNSADDLYSNILSIDSQKLRERLPEKLQNLSWNLLSKVLHDLKSIVQDANTEEIAKAQTIIINITDVVEVELLGQFDIALNDLMEQPENPERLVKAKQLSDCLHLFNNGLSIQKRYIFAVIQKRIPNDAFFRKKTNEPKNIIDRVKKETVNVVKQIHTTMLRTSPSKQQFSEDENSSAGATDDDEEENDESGHSQRRNGMRNSDGQLTASNLNQVTNLFQPGGMYDTQDHHSLQLIDHLSGLFSMINKVCIEQFAIIRNIFPAHTIARVTRVLIQRIFSDPAFGIQARVDAILSPQPPAAQLPISDYLDALLTVREKLSALNVLLLECAADPALMGMGSESESLRKAKDVTYWKATSFKATSSNQTNQPSAPSSSSGAARNHNHTHQQHGPSHSMIHPTLALEDEMVDARMRSDVEIKEFFDDQINQVLTNYVNEYFDKEIAYVRQQYVVTMRKLLDDGSTTTLNRNATKVSAGSLLQLPHLKAEKIKSITILVKTVANKSFLNSIFVITSDAIMRMESIGRDNRKLSGYMKDLFGLQLGCLCDGLLYPSAKACTSLLLKTASVKNADAMMPTMDVLPVLATISYGLIQIKQHFHDHFQRPLLSTPNIIAICKENRSKSFQMVLKASIEALHAWTLNIAIFMEKLLTQQQSKYDFTPKFDPLTGIVQLANNLPGGLSTQFTGTRSTESYLDPTHACDAVCKSIIQLSNTVRFYESELGSYDLVNLFWKPLGQQLLGNLISHIRKFKISVDGAKILLRDLEEYQNIGALMNCVETLDMLVCLREMGKLFTCKIEDVVKMVNEDFRHLDASIVLGLVRSRADFNPRQQNNWSRMLSSTFSNFKWEAPLPWESKKPLTIISFTESMSGNGGGRPLGPKTLRKSSVSVTALYINEAIRQQQQHDGMMSNTTTASSSRDRADSTRKSRAVTQISMDLLESGVDIDKRIQSMEAQSSVTNMLQQQSRQNLQSMKFLPTRPDEDPYGLGIGGKGVGGGGNSSGSSAMKHGIAAGASGGGNGSGSSSSSNAEYFQFIDTNGGGNKGKLPPTASSRVSTAGGGNGMSGGGAARRGSVKFADSEDPPRKQSGGDPTTTQTTLPPAPANGNRQQQQPQQQNNSNNDHNSSDKSPDVLQKMTRFFSGRF